MYPLTENFPKPLLKVRENTIVDWLINDIESSTLVDEYIVVSNHKYYQHFVEWAQDKTYKVTIVDDGTITNETRLGAVKDIQFTVKLLNIDSDLLVIAGDNLLDFSLTKFIAYATEKKKSCIMRYYEPDEQKLKKCGVVEIDEDDRIISMEEKPAIPKSHWCSPPFYYYAKEDVPKINDCILSGCNTDAPGSFIAWLSQKSKVYAMKMIGKRYDIGNIEGYERVKKEYIGIDNKL